MDNHVAISKPNDKRLTLIEASNQLYVYPNTLRCCADKGKMNLFGVTSMPSKSLR